MVWELLFFLLLETEGVQTFIIIIFFYCFTEALLLQHVTKYRIIHHENLISLKKEEKSC